MNEREYAKQKRGEQANVLPVDVEERLEGYYGPELREQPLSSSSWQELRSRLEPHRSTKRAIVRRLGSRFRIRFRIRRRAGRRSVPAHIQTAFSQVAYEARLPDDRLLLACSLTSLAATPTVRVALVGKRKITLRMSPGSVWSLDSAGLAVLVATGLARSVCMRKLAYLLRSLALMSVFPLVCVALIALALLWRQDWPTFVLPLAIVLGLVLCALASWLYSVQSRHASSLADTLMVEWLGRDRACRGLHELADHSRSPSRRSWGDWSLSERIGRVCGTHVRVEEERLTLVR